MSATVSSTLSGKALRVEEKGVPYYLCVSEEKKPLIGILRYGGKYCNKCEVSLLRDGEDAAIYASKVHFEKTAESAEHVYQCPLCETTDQTVLTDCSCFDWRMAPHRLNRKDVQKLRVIDSYGQTQTVEQFTSNLRKYPIQFYNRIEKQ